MASESTAPPHPTTTSYCSTRGGAKGVCFEDVVMGGLAEDRGLYVPEELPTVSTDELAEVSSVCTYASQQCVLVVAFTHGRVSSTSGRNDAPIHVYHTACFIPFNIFATYVPAVAVISCTAVTRMTYRMIRAGIRI